MKIRFTGTATAQHGAHDTFLIREAELGPETSCPAPEMGHGVHAYTRTYRGEHQGEFDIDWTIYQGPDGHEVGRGTSVNRQGTVVLQDFSFELIEDHRLADPEGEEDYSDPRPDLDTNGFA